MVKHREGNKDCHHTNMTPQIGLLMGLQKCLHYYIQVLFIGFLISWSGLLIILVVCYVQGERADSQVSLKMCVGGRICDVKALALCGLIKVNQPMNVAMFALPTCFRMIVVCCTHFQLSFTINGFVRVRNLMLPWWFSRKAAKRIRRVLFWLWAMNRFV